MTSSILTLVFTSPPGFANCNNWLTTLVSRSISFTIMARSSCNGSFFLKSSRITWTIVFIELNGFFTSCATLVERRPRLDSFSFSYIFLSSWSFSSIIFDFSTADPISFETIMSWSRLSEAIGKPLLARPRLKMPVSLRLTNIGNTKTASSSLISLMIDTSFTSCRLSTTNSPLAKNRIICCIFCWVMGSYFFITDNLNPFTSLFGERDRLEKEEAGGFNGCGFFDGFYHIFEQFCKVNERVCANDVAQFV